MKNIFLVMIFLFLLLSPVYQAASQSSSSTSTQTFDTTGFPQWAKDMRRWDIIAFGAFPFAMFFTNFFYDMYLWNNANGMSMSDEGRRYAPWPLKSAGGVEKTKEEFERTLLMAAGVSMTIAFADLIIVLIKRNKERRRIESMPTGSVIINTTPYEQDGESSGGAVDKIDIMDIFDLINALNFNNAPEAVDTEAETE
jgi:hypothetical protein